MEDNTLKRITVLGLIIALLFGILQYIPSDKSYDSFNLEVLLKVFANAFFSIMLVGVLIYLIFIGINLGYGMKNLVPNKFLKGIYNFIVLSSFLSIILILFFGLLISLVGLIPKLTAKIGSYLLISFFIFWLISFYILSRRYIY